MASHPTSKARNLKKDLKILYAKAREDAQLYNVIPTTPEGAVRDERVDPAKQSQQDLTSLDRAAINKGWNVPEEEKQKIIKRLLEKLEDPETSPAVCSLIANSLMKADQMQYERDRPETKAGTTTINGQTNIVTNVDISDLLRRMRQQREEANNVTTIAVESRVVNGGTPG